MRVERNRLPRRRKANLTIEMLLLTPVVLAVVLAAAEIGLLSTAKNKVEAASAIGARVAAQGGDAAAVERVVRAFLGKGPLEDPDIRCTLHDESGLPLPCGEPVEVVVCVRANKAVPDLLGFIGFSLKDKTLSGRTMMRKE